VRTNHAASRCPSAVVTCHAMYYMSTWFHDPYTGMRRAPFVGLRQQGARHRGAAHQQQNTTGAQHDTHASQQLLKHLLGSTSKHATWLQHMTPATVEHALLKQHTTGWPQRTAALRSLNAAVHPANHICPWLQRSNPAAGGPHSAQASPSAGYHLTH
jgi:hypothetical protein